MRISLFSFFITSPQSESDIVVVPPSICTKPFSPLGHGVTEILLIVFSVPLCLRGESCSLSHKHCLQPRTPALVLDAARAAGPVRIGNHAQHRGKLRFRQ